MIKKMRRAQPLNPPQWENELNNSSPWKSGALRRREDLSIFPGYPE
jgi:hypothetical protein